MTWNEKCTASFGKRPCVASASVAVLRNGWVDRALMVGWRGLKIARYDGLQESLNRCRLLRVRDSVRRRLQKRGRIQPGEGVGGCRRLPPERSVAYLVASVTVVGGKSGPDSRPKNCLHRSSAHASPKVCRAAFRAVPLSSPVISSRFNVGVRV